MSLQTSPSIVSRSSTEEAPLRPSENVLGLLDVDLNSRLRFGSGVVVITNQRLISRFPDETAWQSWDLQPGLTLTHFDHAGVGTLELSDASGRWECLSPQRQVSFGYAPLSVHVAREFPPGSCAYREILAHAPHVDRARGGCHAHAALPALTKRS